MVKSGHQDRDINLNFKESHLQKVDVVNAPILNNSSKYRPECGPSTRRWDYFCKLGNSIKTKNGNNHS